MCKLILNWTRKNVWLFLKKMLGGIAHRSFLKPFFLIRENFFQSFRTKFSSSFHVMSLASNISYCLSVNHNPKLWRVICVGVTLFALCYTWTALLSANHIQLFRQRLSHKSVKAYATMPIGIMGRKSLALIDWGLRYLPTRKKRHKYICLCCFPLCRGNT